MDSNKKAMQHRKDFKMDEKPSFNVKRVSEGSTFSQTLINMIKGNIGCGMLGMGVAFKYGGLVFSTFTIVVLLMISCYNQHTLVNLANKFTLLLKLSSIDYAETIGLAFDRGPKLTQKLGSSVRYSINFSILATQFGCCCIYILFITESIQQIGSCHDYHITRYVALLAIFPIVWSTSLIRDLKYITPLSSLANVSICASIMLILYSTVFDLPPIQTREFFQSWNYLPLCFGCIVFAVEGITMTLPLQQTMKEKHRFSEPFGVLNTSLSVLAFTLWSLGFFGYWKFGDDVASTLTNNLNVANNAFAQAVIIFLMIGILLTYTLQFHVGVSIILPFTQNYFSDYFDKREYIREIILRSIMVIISFLVTATIPRLDLFVSLIGAVGSTSLSFVYASLGHLVYHRKGEFGVFGWRLIIDIISLVVGVLGLIFGTAISLREIYEATTRLP